MVPILETPRLLLRRLEPGDLQPLFALYRDPEIRRHYPDGTRTLEQTREELEWFLHGHPRHPELGLWATIEKSSGAFLGRCGLLPWTIGGTPEVELAFMIAKPRWGEGLATEAALGIIDHARDVLGLERLICLIAPENQRSAAVARKVGMNFERAYTDEHGLCHIHGRRLGRVAAAAPKLQPQALLFDLGGVLIDIDFGRALAAWAPHSALPEAELRQAFRFDLPYQRHERGEIGAAAYFDHLASVLRLRASCEEIARGWNSIFVGEIAETAALVRALRTQIACHAFTNTNATHQQTWTRRFPAVVQSFERIFASHELGLRKPSREAFDHIVAELRVPAQSIVFFDDLLENVQAALQAGLQAVHVRSPDDVRHALQALDLSPPPSRP